MFYLSGEQIQQKALPQDRVMSLARDIIEGIHEGSVVTAPRPTLEAGNGNRFIAFPAILEDHGVAGVKWLGTTSGASSSGRGGSVIVLSRIADGEPFAILDAKWITAIRTAAVSLICADALACKDSKKIAFIACGEQAKLHFDLFASAFPLDSVTAYSRTSQTAQSFVDGVSQRTNLEARVAKTMEDCVAGADIVITSAPGRMETLLDARWLKNTAFCSLVDLGRTFDTGTIPVGTNFVIDDREQFSALSRDRKLGRFERGKHASLFDVLADPGRWRGQGGLFMPTGIGAIDIRIAHELYSLFGDE